MGRIHFVYTQTPPGRFNKVVEFASLCWSFSHVHKWSDSSPLEERVDSIVNNRIHTIPSAPGDRKCLLSDCGKTNFNILTSYWQYVCCYYYAANFNKLFNLIIWFSSNISIFVSSSQMRIHDVQQWVLIRGSKESHRQSIVKTYKEKVFQI